MTENVSLISHNRLLLEWCKIELDTFFSVSLISPKNISAQKELLENVSCVLIDYESSDELNILYIYQFFSLTNNIPVIFLYSKLHNLTQKRKAFCGEKFISTFSQKGTLLKEIAKIIGKKDIVQSFENSSNSQTVTDKKILLQPQLTFMSIKEQSKEPVNIPEMSCEAFDIFCGSSPKMKRFKEEIEKASLREDIVLLVGESGTGKSYAAEYIHKHSIHKNKQWFKMNVAEVPETLAESHFFGVASGAYTNAVKTKGIFEEAGNSTLFLDEIGELPIQMQAKILEVIETGRFRKVGSMKEQFFNGRLIFATNANLETKVKKGLFREDLFYRIAILRIEVPPLREHIEDIPFFTKNFINKQKTNITNAAIDKLCSYNWPGNIRELKNVLKRAGTFCSNGEICADDIVFTSNFRSF